MMVEWWTDKGNMIAVLRKCLVVVVRQGTGDGGLAMLNNGGQGVGSSEGVWIEVW